MLAKITVFSLLLAGCALAQVHVDIHATTCGPLQVDPSCVLTPHTYPDGEAHGVLWTQDCAHSEPQGFTCQFDWPPGAAVSGSGVVAATFHVRGPTGDGGTEGRICWSTAIRCRTITGSGDETVDYEYGGQGAWEIIAKDISDDATTSFIYRASSDGTITAMAPGAAGASCELVVNRVLLEFFECDEFPHVIGFERVQLVLPAP